MSKYIKKSSPLAALILCTCGFVLLAFATVSGGAGQDKRSPEAPNANPSAGTVSPTGPVLPFTGTWVGTAPGGVSPEGETTCVEGVTCEFFRLTLSGTPGDWVGKTVRVTISAAVNPTVTDYDVYIHKGTSTDVTGRPNGPLVGSAGTSGTPPEVVNLDPSNPAVGTGVFLVHVVYWAATAADQYTGSVTVLGSPTPTPTPTATPSPTPVAGTPRFFNYYPASGVAEDAGEPTLGSNWQSEMSFTNNNIVTGLANPPIPNGGTTNYYGGFLSFMLRARFNDCSSPADPNFQQMPVTLPATTRVFGDPILFTDHLTGRTFVSQLEGLTPAGSTMEYTDNDGDSFLPSQGAGPSCIDHQTIGGGVFHEPVPPGLVYPNAVYYASQCISDATSQLSLDGGITFPIQTPMFTAVDCAGLHGHLKVGPDGTVYVPDKACALGGVPFVFGGKPAVAVSENNGLTWAIRTVENGSDTDAGNDDPSVGVSWCAPAVNPITGDPIPCDKAARSKTIYLGYQTGGDHRPEIVRSTDGGLTWSDPVDVGAPVGVKSCSFPEVAVGDPDRAAFAFFGTTTPGDGTQPAFPGVWYLYVATTFDGGATWTTTNVTPNDPIQRGGICGDGTCRNLLDFFDIVIDKEGRILIAGEDGCIGGCINGPPNSFTAKAFITRQSGGKRMFAQFDPIEPAVPGAPLVSGGLNPGNTAVTLNWPEPDNSGSPITAYKIYRAPAAAGPYTLIATVPSNSYVDTAFPPGNNYYRVTAVNAIGESPYCKELLAQLVDPPTPCDLPYGLKVVNDLNADGSDNDPPGANVPIDGSVNVRELWIAEPGNLVNKLVFTMIVAPSNLSSPPPNSQWFIVWNRQMPDANHDRWYVAMRTDAMGVPSFEYGKFGVPLDPMNPNQNANTPMMLGAADSGSYDIETGVIKITLSNSSAENIHGPPMPSSLSGLNVRTYFNRPDPGPRAQNNASDITGDGSYTLVGNAACSEAPDLVSAVSRKVHGAAGTFDVKLFPIVPAGNVAIECRKGQGSNSNNHDVVFVFEAPVTYTGASVSGGGSATVDPPTGPANEVTIHLTGVPNEQVVTVTLLNATTGGAPTNVPVEMGVLLGDTSHSGTVNSSDIAQTKSESGEEVDGENFRTDVTVNGSINSSDISLVKSKSGTGLPTAPPDARAKSKKK